MGSGPGIDLSCGTSALEWVREYFGPTLDAAEAPGAPLLETSEDAGALAALLAAKPAAPEERAFYAWDQRVVTIPSWEDGERLYGLDERGNVVGVSPGEISVVADPGTLRWRWTLVITIKEALSARLRGSELEAHAAAIELAGRAIALVGPKGAGKSTLSFHLMRSADCSTLSNDRVFLAVGDDGPIARGMPSAMRIRSTMDAEFPELRAGLPERERHYLYSEAELAGPPLPIGEPAGELIVNPAQMGRALGARRVAEAPLGAILFPEVDPEASGWRLEELDADEVGHRLVANLYGSSTRPRPPTAFEIEAGSDGEPPPELARVLGSTVRGLRIVLGRGAYEGPSFPDALLAEIAPWA
jgi:hypothetical protein